VGRVAVKKFTVRLQTREEIAAALLGQPWTGEKSLNPFNEFAKFTRADRVWAGWLHAVDAGTGVWKWRLKSNYPIMSGVTPTAGRLVFFGDMGGNFYALDAATGQKLWGQKIGGGIGGGVITYTVNGAQKSLWRPATYPLPCPFKSGERKSRSSASRATLPVDEA
jgi:alcohol dehydrogenase (cytochrome c)